MGVDSIADSDNSIKIVEINESLYLTASFLLNLFHFGTSCLFIQFLFLVDISQMLRYRLSIHAK